MELIDAIKTHLGDNSAEPIDWKTVAESMRAISVTAEPRLCYSVETSMAIMAVGGDPTEIMKAMEQDDTGRFLLMKLATVGVAWAHPLTVAYLDAAVAKSGLGKVSRDAAVALSSPTTFPFAEVTPEDCKHEYQTEILNTKRNRWRAQFDAALNTVGTVEAADGVAAVLAIAHEMESV